MTKRKYKPCGDRVLVKLKPIEQKGLIEIPDKYKERDQYATQEAYVEAIGDCAWLAFGDGSPWAKLGDLVKILKYSGEDDNTLEDGFVHRIIRDSDILAVIEGEGLNG